MTFGEKVKAERTKLGMSQDELAAKIGVTRRIIGSYENDKSRPRGMERYKKLAESLNVNVNYLLSEDDAFIADVEDKYGRRGARQAQELLAEVTVCLPAAKWLTRICVKWLTLFRKHILLQRRTIKNTPRRNTAKTSNPQSELSPIYGTHNSL